MTAASQPMRLFYSAPSPFAAKARMAAALCGIALETVATDTTQEPADLLAANPLGKIPALVLATGETVYDSRVICDYLDRLSGHRLVPQDMDGWLAAKKLEAVADGVTDALILTVYEVRYRPEDKRHQPWVDKQTRKAERGLALLASMVPTLAPTPGIGHLALAGLIGWMDVRFPGRIAADHPALAAWLETFKTENPALAEALPKAA